MSKDSFNLNHSDFNSIIIATQAIREGKQQTNNSLILTTTTINSNSNSNQENQEKEEEIPNIDSRPSTSNENPFEVFHREMDDATIRIDMTLREATKMQNLDLDKHYGIERKTKSNFSSSMRALDDRNLRMQAMVK